MSLTLSQLLEQAKGNDGKGALVTLKWDSSSGPRGLWWAFIRDTWDDYAHADTTPRKALLGVLKHIKEDEKMGGRPPSK